MGTYRLPFPEGKSYRVSQGNNEVTSHHGKARFAFDFAMPEGDLVIAARAGVVSRVQENYAACGGSELANKTNFVLIEHYDDPAPCADLYVHVYPNSPSEFGVKPGVAVKQGQPIARAGKVGYSFCGPHLHFQRQERGQSWWQQSVPVSFDDVPSGVPSTGQIVTSQNSAPPAEPEPAPATLLDALRAATFREVGATYHSTDSFVTYAAAHSLGAPMGNYFRAAIAGTDYFIQVFARDTLYVPIVYPYGYPDWAQQGRMGTLLTADLQDPLGLELLDLTFKAAGHTFHPAWATHQYYLAQMSQRPLGAPLGPVQILEVAGGRYDVEIFALDTLYTLEPNWKDVRRLSDLLAQLRQGGAGTPGGS